MHNLLYSIQSAIALFFSPVNWVINRLFPTTPEQRKRETINKIHPGYGQREYANPADNKEIRKGHLSTTQFGGRVLAVFGLACVVVIALAILAV